MGGTDGQHLREHKDIKAIADKYNVGGATILISWLIKRGIVALPKSVTPSRIDDNLKCESTELFTKVWDDLVLAVCPPSLSPLLSFVRKILLWPACLNPVALCLPAVTFLFHHYSVPMLTQSAVDLTEEEFKKVDEISKSQPSKRVCDQSDSKL